MESTARRRPRKPAADSVAARALPSAVSTRHPDAGDRPGAEPQLSAQATAARVFHRGDMQPVNALGPAPRLRLCAPLETLHEAGDWGTCWRLVSGIVRLDEPMKSGDRFAGLLLPGDLIGVESLVRGHYAQTAWTLVPCTLEPWGEPGHRHDDDLLHELARAQHRQADLLSLRQGGADDRMERLLTLLARHGLSQADGSITLTLPQQKHIAEITDLTIETVSRSLAKLRRAGVLEEVGLRHYVIRHGYVAVTSARPAYGEATPLATTTTAPPVAATRRTMRRTGIFPTDSLSLCD